MTFIIFVLLKGKVIALYQGYGAGLGDKVDESGKGIE
jgi:hypothetical protein